MTLNSAIPVRFNATTTVRLKIVSEHTGIPMSQLVRIATDQYLEKIESSRAVTIPLREKPSSHPAMGKSGGKTA